MLTVRDLMTLDPATVEPGETLRAVALRLADLGVGGAPVMRGGRVVGVVSLVDILRFESDEPGAPTWRPDVAEPFEEDALDAPELEEEPAGRWFVEMWDDVGLDVGTRMDTPEGPEWASLDEHTVEDVMSRAILSVSPSASIVEAARAMIQSRVHRLLVVEKDQAVGIVTATDMVRAVALGRLVPAD
jgi:CBS domain-containing protein